MEKTKKTLKNMLKWGLQIALFAALTVFAFFTIYMDITTPGSHMTSFSEMLKVAAEFRGDTLTAAEIEAARQSLFMLIGALLTGAAISAVGMFFAYKHPENKVVQWLFSDYIEGSVDSGEMVKNDSKEGEGSDC